MVEPAIIPYVGDDTLRSCIICDLDGTLALFDGLRGPFEYEKCAGDKVNEPIRTILETFKHHWWEHGEDGDNRIVYLSGREDKAREGTKEFLRANQCPEGLLYMRPTGDYRKDSIVKLELFDAHIRGKFNVLFVLDDRDQVVKMWRDLGLTCLQVAYGNF